MKRIDVTLKNLKVHDDTEDEYLVRVGTKLIWVSHESATLVAPENWPPQLGDVWSDREGDIWVTHNSEDDYGRGADETVMTPVVAASGSILGDPQLPELVYQDYSPMQLVYRKDVLDA